jgi:D-3-phosphoglycerate dehydrogenase
VRYINKAKVLITEPLPLVEEEKKILSRYASVTVANTTSEDQLVELVKDVDVIMVVYAKITKRIINSATKLKGIIRYGIGVDNIDLEAATAKGVIVANVPDYAIETVADHTWALILALVRRIVIADKYVRNRLYIGKWTNPPEYLRGIDLSGKVLGLVGVGRIGREVAKRAKGFGVKILGYDPYISSDVAKEFGIELVNLDTLLRESDIISIHCPLTKETYHLINEDKIRLMRKRPYIINTARGAIIDEKALYKALKEGWIAGAALDVFEIEPPPENNPLFELDNVVLTPHIAWYTEEALRRLEMSAVEEAIRILRGELPKNIVNKEVLKFIKI